MNVFSEPTLKALRKFPQEAGDSEINELCMNTFRYCTGFWGTGVVLQDAVINFVSTSRDPRPSQIQITLYRS